MDIIAVVVVRALAANVIYCFCCYWRLTVAVFSASVGWAKQGTTMSMQSYIVIGTRGRQILSFPVVVVVVIVMGIRLTLVRLFVPSL